MSSTKFLPDIGIRFFLRTFSMRGNLRAAGVEYIWLHETSASVAERCELSILRIRTR